MCFISSKPPKYDCEIFTEAQNHKKGNEDEEEIDTNEIFEDNYLIFVSLIKSNMVYRVYQKEQWYLFLWITWNRFTQGFLSTDNKLTKFMRLKLQKKLSQSVLNFL